MRSLKEKLIDLLGAAGYILIYGVRLLISILPFVMIGGNFLLTLVMISISTFFPISSVVFWIWGLVCAVKGVQDIWAILFYIAFAVLWLPFFISLIIPLFSRRQD